MLKPHWLFGSLLLICSSCVAVPSQKPWAPLRLTLEPHEVKVSAPGFDPWVKPVAMDRSDYHRGDDTAGRARSGPVGRGSRKPAGGGLAVAVVPPVLLQACTACGCGAAAELLMPPHR